MFLKCSQTAFLTAIIIEYNISQIITGVVSLSCPCQCVGAFRVRGFSDKETTQAHMRGFFIGGQHNNERHKCTLHEIHTMQ